MRKLRSVPRQQPCLLPIFADRGKARQKQTLFPNASRRTWIIDPHGSEPVYDRLKALTEERLASNVSANQ